MQFIPGQGCTVDTARSAKIFTDLAMKGHPYAQFALAGLYYSGSGVEQSFTRAFTLYKASPIELSSTLDYNCAVLFAGQCSELCPTSVQHTRYATALYSNAAW